MDDTEETKVEGLCAEVHIPLLEGMGLIKLLLLR
jgi:hypothetical protein